jgi:aspartate 4-decarboxylase
VKGLGIDVKTGTSPLFASYYGLIDFEFWGRKYLGDEVVDFLKANIHPLDIVYRLAKDHAVVLLNGNGFDAPDYTVRVSFANLPDDVYEKLGAIVRAVAKVYGDAYRDLKAKGGNGKSPAEPGKKAKALHHS